MTTAPEWIAAALGVTGAWLVGSHRDRDRLAGFVLFLLSNALWIAWGISVNAWPLVAMQAAFSVTSIRGVLTNRPTKTTPHQPKTP